MEELRVVIRLLIKESVIRTPDYQQVVPSRKSPEAVNQITHTLIRKGKSIQFLILQSMIGNYSRLMTRECLVSHKPLLRTVLLRYQLVSFAGRYVIIRTPATRQLVLRESRIVI